MRHGETTFAPGALLGSRLDPTLSARGRDQAIAAGVVLRGRPVARAMCSPLRRARETAHLALPDAEISVDERWCELDFGDLTGLSWAQAKLRHRGPAIAWRRDALPPPGGEDPATLQARVLEAAIEVLRELDGGPPGDVVVVSHATPIRTVVGSARGWALREHRRVRVGHGGRRVVRVTAATLARWAVAAGGADACVSRPR